MNTDRTLSQIAHQCPAEYERIIIALMDLAAGEATVRDFLKTIEQGETNEKEEQD